MRVLHVMEATIGGTRRHLVDVARGQRAAGLDVHLAVSTLRDPGFSVDLEALQAEGVEVTRVDMRRAISPARDLMHLRDLKRLLRKRRPDIVHTHSSKAGALGRRASLSTGIGARVHTPHTFAFLFHALFGPAKRRLYRAIESRLARHTQALIAVSESEATTFRASGVVPPERIRVVPNGIDPVPYAAGKALDRSALGFEDAQPLVAVVGLVYSAKGQDLALEALTRVGLEDVQVVFVGPGELDEHRARARELGVEDRVRFTGARDDVPDVLATADVLLLPSRWEGMPYVVMEAMAAGLPVVATPVDGARDLVLPGETGFLAREVSADALAESLLECLAQSFEQREALGRAGAQRIAEGFSIESMVRGLISVYDEVS